MQGIPQPKPGAVSKAHGGVLFLDEIGELHPIQMNKLLKVLEDRKVMFESAYYSPDDPAVPRYIHEIFKKGMPADFPSGGRNHAQPFRRFPRRCAPGAWRFFSVRWNRRRLRISPWVRRCVRAMRWRRTRLQLVGRYAACGRDAVNIVQMCAGLAQLEDRGGHYAGKTCNGWCNPGIMRHARHRMRKRLRRVGVVHGLAVFGAHQGAVMEIEAVSVPGTGQVTVTGIVDEEELGEEGHRNAPTLHR